MKFCDASELQENLSKSTIYIGGTCEEENARICSVFVLHKKLSKEIS